MEVGCSTSLHGRPSASCTFSALLLLLLFLFAYSFAGTSGATLTLVNKCSYKIWPGIQTTSSGHEVIGNGGFELGAGQTKELKNVPKPWSGRLWARTGCKFDGNGQGKCETGECHKGIKCNGEGYTPPVTLAEFTLQATFELLAFHGIPTFKQSTFYDVSAVDGFNVPMSITPSTGASQKPDDYRCGSPRCLANVNAKCPDPLKFKVNNQVVACKSGCVAFTKPEYCCTGDHSTPQTCGPSEYSRFFKGLCPTSYSYAYDDPTSTFSCGVNDYHITFCG